MTVKFDFVVEGQLVPDYLSANVTLSLEDLCGTFSFSFPDKWVNLGLPLPFAKYDDVEIFADGELVLTGVIDGVPSSGDGDSQTSSLTVLGRSKPGQLYDGSAIYKTNSWRNRSLADIARDLCTPYGVTVKVDSTVAGDPHFQLPFQKFEVEDGEKVFECLDRGAKMRASLMTSSPRGEVVFTRAGTTYSSDAIRRGEGRILNWSQDDSGEERYSDYIVRVQTYGNDNWFGDVAAFGKVRVKDEGVDRYRPLIIYAEGHGGLEALTARAVNERNVRYGRSGKVTYTVPGWRDRGGRIWSPNVMIPVVDPVIRLNDSLLITKVVLMAGRDKGIRTGLELCDRGAFDLIFKPPKKKRGAR